MLAVLSDVDWRVARVLGLGKDMQPNMFQDENIQFLDITLGYIFSNPADMWSISRYMSQNFNLDYEKKIVYSLGNGFI